MGKWMLTMIFLISVNEVYAGTTMNNERRRGKESE